jgi:cytoskeleton protein RodZ
MSEQTPEVEASVAPEATTHIGDELRAARLARSMDISDVARRLNLEEHVVEGLEQGQYDALPEMAYIRGYLLAYLRLMELPVTLLRSFDEQHPLNVALVSSSARTRSACGRDGWSKCISTGLVILLLIAFGIWAYEQYGGYFDNKPAVTVVEDPAVDEQSEPAPEPEPAINEEVVDAMAADLQEQQPLDASANVGITVMDEAVQVVEPSGETAADIVVPDIQKEEPVRQTPVLRINFLDASWISIKDSNDKLLRGGTFDKGTSIELDNQGEIRLIIGRAKNVEITYAGEPVDLSRYVSVARFTLGKPVE